MSGDDRFSDNLPDDIIVEILARLPVKSLLRFKIVCKPWYLLIKSPRFIELQLRHAYSIEDNHKVILKHCVDSSYKIHVSFLPDKKDECIDLSRDVPVPISFFDEAYDEIGKISVTFYGPCNGIICALGDHDTKQVYRRGDLIALWNPSIREVKRLPISNVPRNGEPMGRTVEIGFGFDPKTKNYKVVRILDFAREALMFNPLVEVYSLATDSWSRIDAFVPRYMRIFCSWSTYLDGLYYWWSGDNDVLSILSFDFENEVFDTIPPPNFGDGNDGIVTLINYKGSLALLANDSEDHGWDSTALWVLNRADGNYTWTKFFKLLDPYLIVVGFFRNDNALVLESVGPTAFSDFQLVSYNPISQQVMESLAYNGIYESVYLQCLNYVESLVSFKTIA